MKGHARLTDLSLGGVGLESLDPPLTLGSKAQVSFAVGDKQLETDAVVTRSEGGGNKVGMEFIKLAPHERLGLEEFIRYHLQLRQEERRRHPRVPARQSIEYVAGGKRGIGRLTDISLNGVGFITSGPTLRKGTQARLLFQLGPERIETEVAICFAAKGRLGASFVNLNDQQRAALEKFVSQAL